MQHNSRIGYFQIINRYYSADVATLPAIVDVLQVPLGELLADPVNAAAQVHKVLEAGDNEPIDDIVGLLEDAGIKFFTEEFKLPGIFFSIALPTAPRGRAALTRKSMRPTGLPVISCFPMPP